MTSKYRGKLNERLSRKKKIFKRECSRVLTLWKSVTAEHPGTSLNWDVVIAIEIPFLWLQVVRKFIWNVAKFKYMK